MQVTNRMCGGGNQRNKRNKAEKKPTATPKSEEPVRGQQEHDEQNIIQSESAEDAVIRHFKEAEGSWKMVAD